MRMSALAGLVLMPCSNQLSGSNQPAVRVQASVGLLTDGTIAVEVQLAELLLQWPFLSDLSFMDAASSIFQPPTEIAEETGDPLHTAAAAAAAQVIQRGALQPWLYLNIIAVNSQFLLPVFDMVRFDTACWLRNRHVAHVKNTRTCSNCCTLISRLTTPNSSLT